jgi:hypothetical protein
MELGIVCILAALPGCGGPQKAHIERVVPVSGTLTYRGTPLEFYQVTFVPDGDRRPAAGVTDAAGKFTLGTNAADDGAPPGNCKVSVLFVGPPQQMEAGSEVIGAAAKMPTPKVRIPDKYANADTSELTQEVPARGLTDLKLDLK